MYQVRSFVSKTEDRDNLVLKNILLLFNGILWIKWYILSLVWKHQITNHETDLCNFFIFNTKNQSMLRVCSLTISIVEDTITMILIITINYSAVNYQEKFPRYYNYYFLKMVLQQLQKVLLFVNCLKETVVCLKLNKLHHENLYLPEKILHTKLNIANNTSSKFNLLLINNIDNKLSLTVNCIILCCVSCHHCSIILTGDKTKNVFGSIPEAKKNFRDILKV